MKIQETLLSKHTCGYECIQVGSGGKGLRNGAVPEARVRSGREGQKALDVQLEARPRPKGTFTDPHSSRSNKDNGK